MSSEPQTPLRDLILALLQPRLRGFGFKGLEVTPGEDYEGDQALYIDLYFDLVQPALDPEPFHFLTTAVREALESQGDDRFPHLRYHFDEQQKVVGWR